MMFTLLQKIIDRVIAYEPGMHHVLQKHQGKVLATEVEGLHLNFYFTILENGIYLSSSPPPRVDAQISGRPFTLARLLCKHDVHLLHDNPYLKMTGDVQFCYALFKAWKAVEFDWYAYVGARRCPPLAGGLHHLLEMTKKFFTESKRQLCADIEEYIHYENKFLVRKAEMENYFSEIATVTHALARLQARVQRLNALKYHEPT